MGKNQSASGLTNVIQYDNNGNIALVSGSTTLMQVSSSGAITTTGTISGGAAADALLLNGTGSLAFVTTASYNVASSSFSSRTTQVEKTYATTGSNTFTGPQFASDTSNAISFTSTASLYSDGGLRVQGNSFVSGTAYFNNIVVYGTSSIQYITSSQVNVGTNIITVNTDTPAVRFGGLAVFDSGSTGLTGSMLWDSEKNHWVYSNPSGSTYSGGMLISGPRSSALGSEQGTTACMLLVGQGGDHLTSSMIYHDSTRTCVPNCLIVGGALNGASATFGGLATINVPTDNTTVGIFHAGGGTANRGLKISTFACTNDNAGVRLDAQTTVGGATLALATAGVDRLTIASTGAATFSSNSNSIISNTFQNTNTTDTNSRNYFNVVAGNVTTSIQAIHNDHSYINVTNNLYFQSGGGVKMTMLSTGNVGIGTSSPGGILQASSENSGNTQLLLVRNYATSATGNFTGCYTAEIRGTSNGNVRHAMLINNQENDATRRVLDITSTVGTIASFVSNGNVGIGISVPSQKLHINSGGFLQTAANSSWYRNVFERNVSSWDTFVSFAPQSSPQYTYGFINITASGYVNGTSAGGVTTSRWYYSITNNSISVSVVGTDISAGSQAPSIRLIVSSNVINVQAQSASPGSTSYTTMFVDAMLGSGYINGTYWIIS
jgi:hypothetical protein